MWTKVNLTLLAAGSIVVSQVLFAEPGNAQAILMAQNPEKLPGRDVLAAGAGTIVDGSSPATISINLGTSDIPARSKLEITLAPATIVPNEKYLIAVSLKLREGAPRRLGTVSFFPARPDTDSVF